VPQVLYRIATEVEDAEEHGHPFKYETVYRYLDETPSMWRLLDADEGTLGGTRPERVCGVGATVEDEDEDGEDGDGKSERGCESCSLSRPVGQKLANRLKRAQREMDSGDTAVARLSDTVSDLVDMKRQKTMATDSKGAELTRKFNAFDILVKSSQHQFLDDSDKEKLGKAMSKQLLSRIESSPSLANATTPEKPCEVANNPTALTATPHPFEAAENSSEVDGEDGDTALMQTILRRRDAEQ
jgi:hypothetical protein